MGRYRTLSILIQCVLGHNVSFSSGTSQEKHAGGRTLPLHMTNTKCPIHIAHAHACAVNNNAGSIKFSVRAEDEKLTFNVALATL